MKRKHNKVSIFNDFTDGQLLEVYKHTLLKIEEMTRIGSLDFVEEISESQFELRLIVLECTERGFTHVPN